MATKLSIYNQSLGHLGERRLASLTEDREPRKVLDDYYDDVVEYCLQMEDWEWGSLRVSIDASASLTPDFGYDNAFVKPTDFVRLVAISANANYDPPLLQFTEEQGYWYADCDPLYVRYVSNGITVGKDLSAWPKLFEDYVVIRLAMQIQQRIKPDDNLSLLLEKRERKALSAARNLNMKHRPPQFQPLNTWVASRSWGLNRSRSDRTS